MRKNYWEKFGSYLFVENVCVVLGPLVNPYSAMSVVADLLGFFLPNILNKNIQNAFIRIRKVCKSLSVRRQLRLGFVWISKEFGERNELGHYGQFAEHVTLKYAPPKKLLRFASSSGPSACAIDKLLNLICAT